MIWRVLLLVERGLNARIRECTALHVARTSRITPHMLRVRFSGKGLEAFDTCENLHVKLLLPPDGASRADWLSVSRDGRGAVKAGGSAPVIRKYTVRAIDAALGQLDIDFVLHDIAGPGAAWAASAKPGDVVGAVGPGGRGLPSADWYIIAGDETALPAIGRMLDGIAPGAEGHIIVEVGSAAEEQPLAVPQAMTLRWLHRGEAAPGTTRLLEDAVREIAVPQDGRKPFVWIGAEFAASQALRRRFRHVPGIGKDRQLIVAYWRREPVKAS